MNLNLRSRVALIMALALALQGLLGYFSFYELLRWDMDHVAETVRVNLCALAQEGASRLHATYSGPDTAWICGDEVLLRRALENLLENSARYAPVAPLRVMVRLHPDAVELQVEDEGPGLPAEALEHVTEEFYRAGHGGKSGAGLGLSVVKHVMQAHQGQLTIENALPHGLHVTLTFPLLGAGGHPGCADEA